MNWAIFMTVLLIAEAFVIAQGMAAIGDGRFSQEYLRLQGIRNSYSFLEHGGMWADAFIISPAVAYAASKYKFEVFSLRGLSSLAVCVAVILALVEVYRRQGIIMGDHCTHDGKTMPAGWIHALFAFAAILVLGRVYLGWTMPVVSKMDVVIFSLLLTPFWYFGVKKFSDKWVFDTTAKIQVAAGMIGIWIVAGIRLWRN